MTDFEHFVLYFAAAMACFAAAAAKDNSLLLDFVLSLLGTAFGVVMFYWIFHDYGIVG